MEFNFGSLNWLAVLVSVIVGQIILTLWFTVIFGDRWAREYGSESRQEHTKEVPPYTYAIGLLCTATLTISIALLQQALKINSLMDGVSLGLFLAVGFCVVTILPGQAFLKRWAVFLIAAGSQSIAIITISTILSVWK